MSVKTISVIIPCGDQEGEREKVEKLCVRLRGMGFEEILIASHEALGLASKTSRGARLNQAARCAHGELLWFLHADTRLQGNEFFILSKRADLQRLGYFDLRFDRDGPWAMIFNQIGAWVRSRVFQMPFGDQGFVVSRRIFLELGGFREDISLGEDHFFVWKWRQSGRKLLALRAPLITSARRYETSGWLRTTLRYGFLTWRQAIPEWIKWVTQRRIKS